MDLELRLTPDHSTNEEAHTKAYPTAKRELVKDHKMKLDRKFDDTRHLVWVGVLVVY
jgi:hypothetical protein